jgi:dipeptidyl aminopeptidase/acylaminoacyl peptidase
MSDQGVTGGDVWIVDAKGNATSDAAGRQPRNLTPGRPATSQWIAWGDDEHIFTCELSNGVNRLVRFRLQGDRTSQSVATSFAAPVFSWPGAVGIGSFDRSLAVTADRSLFVFQASTFNQPPEIFATGPAAASALTQLSHFNEGIKPSWGKAISLTWTNDNFQIQGWLLLPARYDPNKKYPLIVEVHGGPAADVSSSWNGGGGGFSATGHSAFGYFVLMPNPRGSFGQGEAFTQANRKDFGYGDLRDILAGADTAIAKYPIDPNRVGITGWSYGGFMTMFAVTQTHRFRAAVVGAGISDWLSYYGENSIDRWMIPYFGASVYDDPQAYSRNSPITFVKNVTTPTLLVVGDRDGECPAPQSFEFWHALHDLHVPARLVVYPNEGHGFSDPAHRLDVQQRASDWFARYMPPTP